MRVEELCSRACTKGCQFRALLQLGGGPWSAGWETAGNALGDGEGDAIWDGSVWLCSWYCDSSTVVELCSRACSGTAVNPTLAPSPGRPPGFSPWCPCLIIKIPFLNPLATAFAGWRPAQRGVAPVAAAVSHSLRVSHQAYVRSCFRAFKKKNLAVCSLPACNNCKTASCRFAPHRAL
jgi:hypothetical protein